MNGSNQPAKPGVPDGKMPQQPAPHQAQGSQNAANPPGQPLKQTPDYIHQMTEHVSRLPEYFGNVSKSIAPAAQMLGQGMQLQEQTSGTEGGLPGFVQRAQQFQQPGQGFNQALHYAGNRGAYGTMEGMQQTGQQLSDIWSGRTQNRPAQPQQSMLDSAMSGAKDWFSDPKNFGMLAGMAPGIAKPFIDMAGIPGLLAAQLAIRGRRKGEPNPNNYADAGDLQMLLGGQKQASYDLISEHIRILKRI